MKFIDQLQERFGIILASSSPRRKQLLASIGLVFKTIIPNVDEKRITFDNQPQNHCQFLSVVKAMNVYNNLVDLSPKIIIAADTIVVLDNEIINKPEDADEAVYFLKKLSNNRHKVFTGISVLDSTNGRLNCRYASTDVYFRKLSDAEIMDYVGTGSPLDKAGGYGIQDAYGRLFVKKIDGCYNNVVGLPLELLYEMLQNICKLTLRPIQ